MLYLAYKDENGTGTAGLYDYEELYDLLFNSSREQLCIIDLDRIHGKTYADKKEFIRNKALDFQSADSEVSGGGLSMGECIIMQNFFEKYGKRFGLLREFRENCIC